MRPSYTELAAAQRSAAKAHRRANEAESRLAGRTDAINQMQEREFFRFLNQSTALRLARVQAYRAMGNAEQERRKAREKRRLLRVRCVLAGISSLVTALVFLVTNLFTPVPVWVLSAVLSLCACVCAVSFVQGVRADG